jgi:hypothetical protein
MKKEVLNYLIKNVGMSSSEIAGKNFDSRGGI